MTQYIEIGISHLFITMKRY